MMKKSKGLVIFCLVVSSVLLLAVSWSGGYHYANRVKTQPPSVASRILNANPGSPIAPDLQSFLNINITYADKTHQCLPNYLSYTVVKTTDTQAKLLSRCNSGPFSIDAVKVNRNWKLTNISNQFPNYSIPLCSYVKKYDLSKSIEPYCYQQSDTITANPVIVDNM